MAALRRQGGEWEYKVKLSEQRAKTSTPGMLQVRRFRDGVFIADMIYNELESLPDHIQIVDPLDSTRRKTIAPGTASEELLVPVFEAGELIYDLPDLPAIKARTKAQLDKLHESIRRYLNPHSYPAGLEGSLHQYKIDLILQLRGE